MAFTNAVLRLLSFLWLLRCIAGFISPMPSRSCSPTSLCRQEWQTTATCLRMSSDDRKAGVATPEELKEFIAKAGNSLLVADVRNPDAAVEPGDLKSFAVAPVPTAETRPLAQLLIFDRGSMSMPLPEVPKDTPIITHCGAGGRGQKAKDFLEENGFTNVVNGGGPKDSENWAIFGGK